MKAVEVSRVIGNKWDTYLDLLQADYTEGPNSHMKLDADNQLELIDDMFNLGSLCRDGLDALGLLWRKARAVEKLRAWQGDLKLVFVTREGTWSLFETNVLRNCSINSHAWGATLLAIFFENVMLYIRINRVWLQSSPCPLGTDRGIE
ncbi:unnamed protein product [Dovyalis caffra]|uniref:Uncharacterized protein n=1 Tax=Dovyalis caffra TaxID=77055 RepID=A0AAV1ST27_9ROSI|nr:unnamed protein product [Dovyalis caffra]